ncbi:MAG TPA: AMP-binding protein, partial [Myxococcaceae bacterium]|nr:AMP-binding protein [Myxococcaceae bacterium]
RAERAGTTLGPVLAAQRAVADRRVFQRVRAVFGGRLQCFVSGSAPLAREVTEFFDAMGVAILEGYGLTETSAGTFVNRPGKNRIGTVGPPVPGTEVRIAEDGEILVKGPCVMKGYHGDPAGTAEVLRDGWLATGDIGLVDEAGCLKITDRKKDIIVTAGGKNVAPQNIENDLKTDPLISQVMVHGDRRKFLSALITLNEDNLRAWATGAGLAYGPELRNDARLKARVQQAIDTLNAKQASYSTIKKWEVLDHDFTQASGELTPTLKVKRKLVTERYRALLDSFYAE